MATSALGLQVGGRGGGRGQRSCSAAPEAGFVGRVRDAARVPSSQEKQDKAVLQAEVQHLRRDNLRLQEESQTATAQLRKFTEWFFNTIDKKS